MSSLTPIEISPEAQASREKEVEEEAEAYLASCARDECLAKINGILDAFNVPRWTDGNLGVAAKGQCEVVDMVDMEELVEGKRVRLELRVRLPTGVHTNVKVNFGGKIVYVVPYLQLPSAKEGGAESDVFLIKRWRIETGNWSFELPHGLVFDEDRDFDHPFESPAHEILTRTFGKKGVGYLSAAHVHLLGKLTLKGENARAETCVLAASIRFTFEKRLGDCEIVRQTLPHALSLIEQGVITDVNTVATLLRAANKFGAR